MKRLLACTTLLAFGLASTPASASTKFSENMALPQGATVNIDVSLSEDMQHRANNLPRKLSDRGHARSRNQGFAGNGYYGEKDLNLLVEDLQEEFTMDLSKAGLNIAEAAPFTLKLVITDARPSRPTFNQLSRQANLSIRSVGRGGATIEGQLIDASGVVIGTSSYRWYEDDIRDSYASGTWSEAKRAFSRYARHSAKSITE